MIARDRVQAPGLHAHTPYYPIHTVCAAAHTLSAHGAQTLHKVKCVHRVQIGGGRLRGLKRAAVCGLSTALKAQFFANRVAMRDWVGSRSWRPSQRSTANVQPARVKGTA